MAVMDAVVGHYKNTCCMRGFERLFDGSFGGQKDAHLKLWPTGIAVHGSSSGVRRLQSTVKCLDTTVQICTRRFATPCPESLTLHVGGGNRSISFYAALVRGSHLFPIKILRAVHTPIMLPGPLACQLHPSSRTLGFSMKQVVLQIHSPCAFPQCSLITPLVFCVRGCVYFTAAVCSGSKNTRGTQ